MSIYLGLMNIKITYVLCRSLTLEVMLRIYINRFFARIETTLVSTFQILYIYLLSTI